MKATGENCEIDPPRIHQGYWNQRGRTHPGGIITRGKSSPGEIIIYLQQHSANEDMTTVNASPLDITIHWTLPVETYIPNK